MKTTLSVLTLSLFASPAFAQLSDSAGFSGELSFNVGYTSSTSNFNTPGDKTIDSLSHQPSSDNGFIAAPLGNLAYTFGVPLNQQFYVGTSREDLAVGTLALEVGYKHKLGSGTVVDISYLPTIMSGKTWEDPYLVGEKRSTTEETGHAYRLKLSNLFGSGLSIDTAYANKDVEDEASGTSQLNSAEANRLRRDAQSYYIKGSYRFPLSRTAFIQPSMTFIKTDAKGEANSLNSVGGEISYFKIMNRHQLALTAGYTTRSYDEENPLYNKTREDGEWSLFAAYEYKQFMGWQNWSLIGLAGYGSNQANINFYDTQESLVSAGINYRF